MTSRHIRQERRAAQERDHSWTEERDADQEAAEVPDEEYGGLDEANRLAQEFRG